MTIIDGIVRFDRKNDAGDMRMEVDAAQPVPMSNVHDNENIDRCMQGMEDVWSFLFGKEHKH
jgi:hypothetical protein